MVRIMSGNQSTLDTINKLILKVVSHKELHDMEQQP